MANGPLIPRDPDRSPAGQLIEQGRAKPAAPMRAPKIADDDIWQGYHRNETGTGFEFRVQTGASENGPAIVGWVTFATCVVLFAVTTPANGPEDSGFISGIVVGAFIGVFAGMLMNLFASYLKAKGLLGRQLETIEIRPDGITINRKSFFPRRAILSMEIEATRKPDGRLASDDYDFGLVAIIGTRRMELMTGLDAPTAKVLIGDIETAKRLLWVE